MPYPFQMGVKNMDESSWKLKVMAISGDVPVSEMCRQIIDWAFNQVDQKKIKQAEKQLGRRKQC